MRSTDVASRSHGEHPLRQLRWRVLLFQRLWGQADILTSRQAFKTASLSTACPICDLAVDHGAFTDNATARGHLSKDPSYGGTVPKPGHIRALRPGRDGALMLRLR